MPVRFLAFASTRDCLGFHERMIECEPDETPRSIITRLVPSLDLAGIRVAIDSEYCDWDSPIGAAKEIALIPPVSGG